MDAHESLKNAHVRASLVYEPKISCFATLIHGLEAVWSQIFLEVFAAYKSLC